MLHLNAVEYQATQQFRASWDEANQHDMDFLARDVSAVLNMITAPHTGTATLKEAIAEAIKSLNLEAIHTDHDDWDVRTGVHHELGTAIFNIMVQAVNRVADMVKADAESLTESLWCAVDAFGEHSTYYSIEDYALAIAFGAIE